MVDKEKPVLIEQTSKRLKVIRLVGVLLMVAAILPAIVLADEYGPTTAGYVIAGSVFVLGLIVYGVGMAITWWQHG